MKFPHCPILPSWSKNFRSVNSFNIVCIRRFLPYRTHYLKSCTEFLKSKCEINGSRHASAFCDISLMEINLSGPRVKWFLVNRWIRWVCGGEVGQGTGLHTRTSRVRFSMGSFAFFTDLILPAAPWPGVDSASTRYEYQEGKGGWYVRLIIFMCRLSGNPRSLKLLEG